MTLGEFVPRGSVSYPNFVDWRAQSTVFELASAVRSNENYNFTGAGEPERLSGRLVSAGFFLTGTKPFWAATLLLKTIILVRIRQWC